MKKVSLGKGCFLILRTLQKEHHLGSYSYFKDWQWSPWSDKPGRASRLTVAYLAGYGSKSLVLVQLPWQRISFDFDNPPQVMKKQRDYKPCRSLKFANRRGIDCRVWNNANNHPLIVSSSTHFDVDPIIWAQRPLTARSCWWGWATWGGCIRNK
jgi:hypothetical protein